MKKIRISILLLSFSLIFISCKKEKEEVTTTTEENNNNNNSNPYYFKMKINSVQSDLIEGQNGNRMLFFNTAVTALNVSTVNYSTRFLKGTNPNIDRVEIFIKEFTYNEPSLDTGFVHLISTGNDTLNNRSAKYWTIEYIDGSLKKYMVNPAETKIPMVITSIKDLGKFTYLDKTPRGAEIKGTIAYAKLYEYTGSTFTSNFVELENVEFFIKLKSLDDMP